MKKGILSILLCLLLAMSGALAEEGALYTPGELTNSLFDAAFDAGKIITGDVTMVMDLDSAKLGVSGQSASIMGAVLDLLADAHLRFGVGKLDEGFRLTLGATLDAPEGATDVTIDAAANIDWDGVSVESDLIPGERVTAKWETLLALAGADEEQIAVFSALRDVDWDAKMQELNEALVKAIETASELAAPYVAAVADYLSTLPADVQENVPEDNGYPAVDLQVSFELTAKNLADIATLLVDQFEQDETLLPAFDAMLQKNNSQTAAELIAQWRDGIDKLSKEPFSLLVTLGASEAALSAFVSVEQVQTDDPNADHNCFNLIFTGDEAAESHSAIFEVYTLDSTGNLGDAFSFTLETALDSDDPILFAAADVSMLMNLFVSGEEVYNLSYDVTTKGTTTDDNLPAAQAKLSEVVVIDAEGTVVRMVMDGDLLYGLTADGGESFSLAATIDSYVGSETRVTMPIVADAYFHPADGGVAGYETVSYRIPEVGINDLTLNVAFASEDYDPASTAALTPLALETATREEVSALVGRLSNAGMMKLFMVMPLLPQELSSMLLSGGQ